MILGTKQFISLSILSRRVSFSAENLVLISIRGLSASSKSDSEA